MEGAERRTEKDVQGTLSDNEKDEVSSIGDEDTITEHELTVTSPSGGDTLPRPTSTSKAEALASSTGNSGYEDAPSGAGKRMLRFCIHNGIPSVCFRFMVLCSVLLGFGTFGRYQFPNFTVGEYPLAFIMLTVGYLIAGYIICLCVLHMFVVICHQRRYFEKWNFIHYLSELEKHVALSLCIVICLCVLTVDGLHPLMDEYVFGSAEFRSFSVKIGLGLLVSSFLLAAKRHHMKGLAMSFNYSNYKDRIQESIFADKMLTMLQKSRHTYKFRQKWRAHHQSASEQTVSLNRGRFIVNVVRSARLNFPTSRPVPHPHTNSVRSAMEIFTPLEPPVPSSLRSVATPAESAPATPIVTLDKPMNPPMPTTTTAKTDKASVADYLTESDKKRQFADFFRLANKMIARFSNVAEYRTEIQFEAKKTADKLYKYLRQEDRDYLLGQDLLPYIEDMGEFCRAVSLIKRHAEGGCQGGCQLKQEDATKYAFRSQDLTRAIDGILTELYVTAKSLQTIETALDKVDFFFTMLVVLIMVVIVAVVMGNGSKLLLALSTMLSGAAFAFGTSARNMFESMIFLLVIHPFDVGDRVFIALGTTSPQIAATAATMSGVEALDNLIVVEMHLLSTVFERWDGVRLYVPNYVLAGKPIFNIRRSGPLMETQRLHIDFSTPVRKIEELRLRIEEFLRRETADYTDVNRVFIDSMENCNKININVLYQHKNNWQDMDQQLARRSKMVAFLKETLEQMEISYLPPVQRVALIGADSSLISVAEQRRIKDLSRRTIV